MTVVEALGGAVPQTPGGKGGPPVVESVVVANGSRAVAVAGPPVAFNPGAGALMAQGGVKEKKSETTTKTASNEKGTPALLGFGEGK